MAKGKKPKSSSGKAAGATAAAKKAAFEAGVAGTEAGAIPAPQSVAVEGAGLIKRPRLHKLTVSNFRCIGSTPVEIELDDIVVLVGPNNVGKSSLLRAYEVVIGHGGKEGMLTLDDFPNGKVDAGALPTIELETVVFDVTAPGAKWVRTDALTNEMYVRERWTWEAPGKAKRVGWDVTTGDWHAKEVPWGAPGVAQPNRPEPHRISAFDSPDDQAKEVVNLLTRALTERVKEVGKPEGEGEKSPYEKLLEQVKQFQAQIVGDAKQEIEQIESALTETIAAVFPNHVVKFDARAEDDLDKSISLFKASPALRIGLKDGYLSQLDRQGSGARRTLLWAALRLISERKRTAAATERPHLLLMDEPEICLHPSAIREARDVLYNLPSNGNWQVMVTTHSPVFIDFARDNTSFVRVERKDDGAVSGTTIYRPIRAQLSDDEQERLKLLNHCDPYVAEFFFGGKTVIVEGDTEHTAFALLLTEKPQKFAGVHVVRARGKATIVALSKVLDQFGSNYSILHDSDRPKVIGRKSKKERANPAWTINNNIQSQLQAAKAAGRVRLFASVPNFEEAYLGEAVEDEKPYNAFLKMRNDAAAMQRVEDLLAALTDWSKPAPQGACEWTTEADLQAAVTAFDATTPAPVAQPAAGSNPSTLR